MNNIGKYEFTEECRERIIKLAELINEEEKFVNDAIRYISLKSFNELLKSAPKDVVQELISLAGKPDVFQSYFRTHIDESKVKVVFTTNHNLYIDRFIEECGGNYTNQVLEDIKSLKF